MRSAEGERGRALPIALWIVAGLFVAGGLLWGATLLDERERPTEVAGDAEDSGRPKDLFVVEVKEERRPTIVIECDEGVLADANSRFREFLDVKDPPLSIPGGPFLLARLPEEWSEEQGPVARSAIEVLKRYAPEKVILLSHSECLLYDVAAAYTDQAAFVPAGQAADLARAAKHVRTWLPHTKVEAYYGRKDGPRIRYNAVPLTATEEVR